MERDYFDAYQAWTEETVVEKMQSLIGSPTELSYLTLGLVSEVREYFDELYLSDRMKEGGDILWYIARLCNHFNLRFHDVLRTAQLNYVGGNAAPIMHNVHLPVVFQCCGLISDITKKIIRDGEPADVALTNAAMLTNFSRIVSAITTDLTARDEAISEDMYADPDYFRKLCMALCEGNKMKLLSRKSRNVLGGSGNDR